MSECEYCNNGICMYDWSGIKADRDRWRERCEAAENVIFCADGYCTTDDYYNAFGVWDAIKSEMGADQ